MKLPPLTIAERQARLDAHNFRLCWCVSDDATVVTNHRNHDIIVRFKNLRERGQIRFCVDIHTYNYPASRSIDSVTLDSPSFCCVTWEDGIRDAELLLLENGFLQ